MLSKSTYVCACVWQVRTLHYPSLGTLIFPLLHCSQLHWIVCSPLECLACGLASNQRYSQSEQSVNCKLLQWDTGKTIRFVASSLSLRRAHNNCLIWRLIKQVFVFTLIIWVLGKNLCTPNFPAIIRRVGHVISGIPWLLVTLGQQRLIRIWTYCATDYLWFEWGLLLFIGRAKEYLWTHCTPDIIWNISGIYYKDIRFCYLFSMQFGCRVFMLWQIYRNIFFSLFCSSFC